MKLNLKRVVLASVAAAGLVVVGAAAPAQAATYRGCDWHYDIRNGEGKLTFYKNYNLKVGPLGECDHVRSVSKGTDFYVWCFYENQYGNKWVYGRVAGTETKGWAFIEAFGPIVRIPDGDDDDNGDGITKLELCGF
jgi:hypothetical protein